MIKDDDVVMIKDENLPRNVWQLARVSAVYPSSDGQVRKVQVSLADRCLDNKGKKIGTVFGETSPKVSATGVSVKG